MWAMDMFLQLAQVRFRCSASSTSCSATLFMALRLWTRSCSGCRDVFWCSASSTSCSAVQSMAPRLWTRSCWLCKDVFGDDTFSLWHLGYGHALADFASAFASMCPCLVALAGLPGKTDTRRNVANIRRFFPGRAPLMWCGFSARAKWILDCAVDGLVPQIL
jgi:hypothetical protein